MSATLDPRVCDPILGGDVRWFHSGGGVGWTDGRLMVWLHGHSIPPEFTALDATADIGERAEKILAHPNMADSIDLRDLALFALSRTPRDCMHFWTGEDDGLWVLPPDPCKIGGRPFDRRLVAQLVAAMTALAPGPDLWFCIRQVNSGHALWVGDKHRRVILMGLQQDEPTQGFSFEDMRRTV